MKELDGQGKMTPIEVGAKVTNTVKSNWTAIAVFVAVGALVFNQGRDSRAGLDARIAETTTQLNACITETAAHRIARVEATNERIDDTNSRIDRIEAKMEDGFEQVNSRIDRMDEKIDRILLVLGGRAAQPAIPVKPKSD